MWSGDSTGGDPGAHEAFPGAQRQGRRRPGRGCGLSAALRIICAKTAGGPASLGVLVQGHSRSHVMGPPRCHVLAGAARTSCWVGDPARHWRSPSGPRSRACAAPGPQPAPLTVPTWRTGQRGFLARATGSPPPPYRDPPPDTQTLGLGVAQRGPQRVRDGAEHSAFAERIRLELLSGAPAAPGAKAERQVLWMPRVACPCAADGRRGDGSSLA